MQSAVVGKVLKEQESKGGMVAAICAGQFYSDAERFYITLYLCQYHWSHPNGAICF